MNKKITTSVIVCLLLTLTMVSAGSMTYEDVNAKYNKKANEVTVSFDAILDDACSVQSIIIRDKKGTEVGKYSEAGTICGICFSGGCNWFVQHEGSVSESHVIELDKKPKGKLTYEIVDAWEEENIKAEGVVKRMLRRMRTKRIK